MEAAFLWREQAQQIEIALVIDDDDFLNDLAKAIRGEAQPEPFKEFTTKVLGLLRKGATRATSMRLCIATVWLSRSRMAI
jgi:hypothetical protein